MSRTWTSLLAYIVAAYGISWALWSPLWLPAFGVEGVRALPYQHELGAAGPITAAFLITALTGGKRGAKLLWDQLFLWRNRIRWLMIALLAPIALLTLAVALDPWLGSRSASFSQIGVSRDQPGWPIYGFFLYELFTFGFGEEVGWRGFALPRLQSRHSALTATVILTLIWAGWHAPLFLYRPGYVEMGAPGILGWVLSLFTGAILLTWLYNETRGSLLVVSVFHAAIDVAFTSDVNSPFVMNALGAMVTVWGVAMLVFAGPRYLARTGKRIQQPGHDPEFVLRVVGTGDPANN